MNGSSCAVEGCPRPLRYRGWCSRHYRAWLKWGDPLVSGAPTKGMSLDERMALYVDRSGGPEACWPWTGKGHHVFGYGEIWNGTSVEGAHRVAWRLANGPIPKGAAIEHSCDNPPCCNPAHLVLGTQTSNIRGMWRRGRGVVGDHAGQRNPQSKLTDELVREIRARRARGDRFVAIAKDLGIHWKTAAGIVHGRTWTHVD